jgi:Threonine dehydrogenase and related Zn-dependent dehydrogenases
MCKSDVEVFEWTPLVAGLQLPFTLGHEFAGEVVEVGRLVKNFKPGDKVAGETHIPCGYCHECRTNNQHICSNEMGVFGRNVDGSFAEYICLPEISAIKLEPDADYVEMSLLEPLGTALHALQKIDPSGKTVAILGVGTIGLMACELAKLLGAVKVISLDVNESRLAYSLTRGADIAINGIKEDFVARVKEETDGIGVECIADFTGNSIVINQAIDALATAGRLVHVGMVGAELTIPNYMYRVVYKELKITGIFGRHMFNTWEVLMLMLKNNRIDLSAYVGAQMPLTDYQKALDMFDDINGRAIMIP